VPKSRCSRIAVAPAPDGTDPPGASAAGALHAALRAWREVIAEFVAERTAAYEHWFDNPAADLGALLDSAMRELNAAFTGSLSEQEPEVHAP
jgi:hypothetical protein